MKDQSQFLQLLLTYAQFIRHIFSRASGMQLKIVIDEADVCLRSMLSEISLSTVLQRKNCRQSKGYSTTNINSDDSFLPINNSISPSKVPDQGIITSFLKVSQINKNSFEEFQFGRPDDFCYLIKKLSYKGKVFNSLK
tara:strand:- start:4091 stop:4504 length:414 start_codon:yes stop_codon:yes gene_type:complete